MNKIIRDILDLAIAEINLHGWHQGSLKGQDGSICLAEAYSRACGRLTESFDRHARNERARCWERMRELTGDDASLPKWNDAYGRTKEEVVALLERTKLEYPL